MKIGDKVMLKERYIKNWVLTHDKYLANSIPSTGQLPINSSYHDEIQLALMQLMGVPVIGKVVRYGSDKNTFGVEFNFAGLKDFQYYNKSDLVPSV